MESAATMGRCLILMGVSFFLPGPAVAKDPLQTRAIREPSHEIGGDQLILDGEVMGVRVPPRAGDICLLCNQPLDAQDLVYLVDGQRMALHDHEKRNVTTEELRVLLTHLKPYGSFWGRMENHLPMLGGWFFLGLYALMGFFFAALSAHRALDMGRNPVFWFGLGMVFSGLAYIVLLTRPGRGNFAPAGIRPGLTKISATYAPVSCPGCGAEGHPAATRCGSCGKPLTPSITSEVARAGLPPLGGR